MDAALYTKSVEELMMNLRISVTDASYKKNGQQWWHAWQTSAVTGEGESPRDAIIDYWKKKTAGR